MADYLFGGTSNIVRFTLKHATTGAGLTALAFNTAGLIISAICDNEATPTVYTVTGSTIETITTLGTFAAPTATKCRFKEVDATNHPGLYEFQFADARFAVASAKRMVITVSGAANLLAADFAIDLVRFNPFVALAPSDIFTHVPSLPGSVPALGTATVSELLAWIGMRAVHKFTQTNTTAAIRNAADNANLFTAPASDNGTTFLVGPWS